MVAIIQQNGLRRELRDDEVVKADKRGRLYVVQEPSGLMQSFKQNWALLPTGKLVRPGG